MKQYFFLLFLLTSSCTYGQILIGKTEEYIRHEKYSDKIFTEGFTTDDHIRWIQYSDSNYTSTYFFNKNYLSMYCVLLPKKADLLSYTLQSFQKDWKKISDSEWEQTTSDDIITTNFIYPQDKGRPYFLVGSKKNIGL